MDQAGEPSVDLTGPTAEPAKSPTRWGKGPPPPEEVRFLQGPQPRGHVSQPFFDFKVNFDNLSLAQLDIKLLEILAKSRSRGRIKQPLKFSAPAYVYIKLFQLTINHGYPMNRKSIEQLI